MKHLIKFGVVIILILTTLSMQTNAQSPHNIGTWANYTNGNKITALAIEGNILWAGTSGGVVEWNMTTGTYEKY